MDFKQINYKSKLIIISLLLFYKSIYSQLNLIVNPSFEDSITIPLSHSQVSACVSWTPQTSTPDFFSVYSPTNNTFPAINVSIPKNSFGYQKAKDGNFYVGMDSKAVGFVSAGYPAFANYYESLQGKLIQPLVKNHLYNFTMFYSLADGCGIASNQLQVYFTNNQFTPVPLSYTNSNSYYNNLNYQAQNDTTKFMTDTMNWQPIQNCFIASGGEYYLSIGNYRDGIYSKAITVNRNTGFSPSGANLENNSYYYIDDLSLYDLGYYSGKAKAKKDTIICFNSNTIIGNNIKDSATIVWQPNTALNCTNCPNPIANPTVTTKYYITKTLGCITSKDSITLTIYTPTLTANAGLTKVLCPNQQTTLGVADSTQFATYNWQPNFYLNCNTCATPITNPNTTLTYTLNKTECAINSTSTVQVILKDTCDIVEPITFIPQAFSPNGDGTNETFVAKLANVNNAKLYIYNRWGNQVFKTQTTNNSSIITLIWDGKYNGELMPSSTYFYIIETQTTSGELKNYKGFVVLVR